MKGDVEASRIGEVVGGKYRIVRLLATGGMGVVYEAQHAVVRRRFAIKFLRRDLSERRDILTRFQHEAEAAGALENHNVMAAIDFGISDDGAPYIVMEYLVGESLGALLEREGRMPVSRAADLIAQACRGVAAAHEIGIVHRDLKPHNLFVCRREDGTDLLKVLDFGVAKLQVIDEASAATRTGMVLGTAAYMSPEQARGDRTVDSKTDVYALGAILYELVSQKRPHPGDSQNAILHHISTQPPVPLESVQPDLAPAFVDVVKRAIASDPAARPASAAHLVQALAPFARREVWPVTREDSGPTRAELTSTVLAERQAHPAPSASSLAPATADDRRPAAPTPAAGSSPAPTRRTRSRASMVIGVSLAVAALAVAITAGIRTKAGTPTPSAAGTSRPLAAATRFYVPPSNVEAIQQIARLTETHAFPEVALLTSLEATPRAVWFTGGSPEEVEAAVRKTVLRAAHDGTIPVLVAYDLPYRDCAGSGAGGARDALEYKAWIDGFARGVGGDKAVVILEPDSLGIIPFNTTLGGTSDSCKPTLAGTQGPAIPAPGATATEHYMMLTVAIDRLASGAPNALVYLDGTHSSWLPVGEIAYRLAKAGVERTQGFIVNTNSFHLTAESIQYGTLISKCLAYVRRGPGETARFRDCPSAPPSADPTRAMDWAAPASWYVDHVDRSSAPDKLALTHFVIDTSRSGRGSLDVAVYAAPPYAQPKEVVAKLREGDYCNPPDAGVGPRPTVNTASALVDAYLWVKGPGESDGPCSIAGGARAWDYSKYNPWGLLGDAQQHFDPLWGMVDPEAGDWFPEQALQLARDADPPLDEKAPGKLADGTGNLKTLVSRAVPSVAARAAGEPIRADAEPAARPMAETDGRTPAIERSGHRSAAHHFATESANGEAPATPPANNIRQAAERRPAPTFDSDNPYR